MRNREIVKKLELIIGKLIIEPKQVGADAYQINNHSELIGYIYILEELNIFKEDMIELISYQAVYANQMRSIVVNKEIRNIYVSTINTLKLKIQGVIESSKLFQKEEKEFTISVKLPEYRYLSEISKFASDLDQAIALGLSADEVRTEVEIVGFDTGSMWFEVCLKTSVATTLIGRIIWAAFAFKQKQLEIEKRKLENQALELNIEHLNALDDALDNSVRKLIEAESRNIISEYNIPEDNHEYRESLVRSIKTFSVLIRDGCQIHARIESEENDEKIFPSFDRPELNYSKIKQITGEKAV